ncbi:GroES-like protein, partial [Aureobasidium melanogenum]
MAAVTQAAALAEKAIGHGDNAITEQDVTNPARDRAKYGDPNETMKALVWQGKNTVEVIECPKPKIVEPRDVILKVTGSTVCGSDLHLLHGSVVEMEKGDILGHEFCGIIDQVGSAVTNHKVGERVVASFQIACGDCMYCKKKLSSQCEKTNSNTIENAMYGGRTAGMFGYSHFTGGFAGGQAEYVRVPCGDVNLLHLPDDVPDEKGLYLSDVVSTSWNCVVDTGVKEGDVVAIWGAGPIGQMCIDFSYMNGAKRVIVIDQNWRLDYCKSKYPNIETIDFSNLPKGETVVSTLKKMEHGGPDVALECVAGEYPKSWAHTVELMAGLETDTPEIINEMIESVKNYGRCGITGVYVGYTNHFNIGSLMERGIRLIGNGQAPVHLYWEKLLKYIQEGKIDPLKMVTHRVAMEDLAKVYYMFDKKEDGMQKVYVETKFSQPACAGSPALKRYS